MVDPLVEVLHADNLVAWEQSGAVLNVNGRGDGIPQDVQDLLPKSIKEDFHNIVESSVEIGLVSMYGEANSESYDFLKKTESLLKKYDARPIDSVHVFAGYRLNFKKLE